MSDIGHMGAYRVIFPGGVTYITRQDYGDMSGFMPIFQGPDMPDMSGFMRIFPGGVTQVTDQLPGLPRFRLIFRKCPDLSGFSRANRDRKYGHKTDISEICALLGCDTLEGCKWGGNGHYGQMPASRGNPPKS